MGLWCILETKKFSGQKCADRGGTRFFLYEFFLEIL